MTTLFSRLGDVQALKAIISSKLGANVLSCTASPDLQAVRAKGSNPFATNTLALVVSSGTVLTDANIVAKHLLASKPIQEVQSWLDWEMLTLRPSTYLGGASLAAAITHLEQALQKSAAAGSSSGPAVFLCGAELTVADVAVYSTLLPLTLQTSAAAEASPVLTPLLTAYLAAMGALPLVAESLKQLLDGKSATAILSTFEADRATYRASRPKQPIPGQRNILITSALPYVNNVPHLGNIIGCVLSADCYARYCRSRGHNCIYVCGTDEYGTATETKALEEGLTCQQICDKYHAIHADIYSWFDIEFDRFGRTPTRAQTSIAQSIFQTLQANEQLVEQENQQLYSEALGKFLADRYVFGTCPKCKYEDARGDQCDACGNLLNPTELINPRCKVTGTKPVLRPTRHIFLDLPKLTPELQSYITTTSEMGGWSSNCVGVTNAWMRDGLKNRCITRDLKWGTPVPMAGYENKVFYVWFDAPIGYISITANYTPEWEAWWKNPKEVDLVQFMGKDNVPFHTVIFPATLLGTKEEWTMMKNISVTEYLNYEGGKFSKSRGTGVFGNDARNTGIPSEVWRFYLLANRPESSDTDFKWTDLAARNNAELLANLGNFINRALMFVSKFFGGVVPTPSAAGAEKCAELGASLTLKLAEYVAAMEKIKLRDGIKIAMGVSADGNKFLQESQPWVLLKTDPPAAATVVAAALGYVRVLASIIQPYMPSLSEKIRIQLNLPPSALDLTDALIAGASCPQNLLQPGHVLGTPSPLVKEIPEELIEELRSRFGGSQADRLDAEAAKTGSSPAAPAAPNKYAAAASQKTAAAGPGQPRPAAAAQQPKPAPAGATASAPATAKPATASQPKAAKVATEGAAAATHVPGTPFVVSDEQKAAAAEKAAQKKAAKLASGAGAEKVEKVKEEEREVDVSRLDIRVARIVKAWRHPDADSLYVEEVDVGEAAPRQIVSGLVKYIPDAAQLTNRRVLIVANMKPANMRGVLSGGMVLAASNADGTVLELLEPPASAAVGERVTFDGFPGEADAVLNPKKKVFELVQPEFTSSATLQAVYRGVPFMTSGGPVTVSSIVGANIK